MLIREGYDIDWNHESLHSLSIQIRFKLSEFEKIVRNIEQEEIDSIVKDLEWDKRISGYMMNNKLFQDPDKYTQQITRMKLSRNKLEKEIEERQKKVDTINQIIPNLEEEREEKENSIYNDFQRWMVNKQETKDLETLHANLDIKCSICLENYDREDHRRSCITVCGHQFCSICILKFSGSCPKCRKSFKKDQTLKLF